MKITNKKLLSLAVAGLVAGLTSANAYAADEAMGATGSTGSKMEQNGCNNKAMKDKATCSNKPAVKKEKGSCSHKVKGHSHKDKATCSNMKTDAKEKSGCSGKNGCNNEKK